MPSCWVFRAVADELRVNAAMDRGFQNHHAFPVTEKIIRQILV